MLNKFFFKFGSELIIINFKNGKKAKLLMFIVGNHKFRKADINYILLNCKGVSTHIALNVVCLAEELDCGVSNCTLKE